MAQPYARLSLLLLDQTDSTEGCVGGGRPTLLSRSTDPTSYVHDAHAWGEPEPVSEARSSATVALLNPVQLS
jgi:hypothetical protein